MNRQVKENQFSESVSKNVGSVQRVRLLILLREYGELNLPELVGRYFFHFSDGVPFEVFWIVFDQWIMEALKKLVASGYADCNEIRLSKSSHLDEMFSLTKKGEKLFRRICKKHPDYMRFLLQSGEVENWKKGKRDVK